MAGICHLPQENGNYFRTQAQSCFATPKPRRPPGTGLQGKVDATNLRVITTAAPSAQDQTLMQEAWTLIEADPHFQALKSPVLSRAEVNAWGAAPGDLYLRYDVPGARPTM